MRVLIIEDEPIIARRIKRMVSSYLDENLRSLAIAHSVESGLDYINQNEIDLLFLDLNLHGEDGFSILERVVAASFHTIIISAYKEKAIIAFEYGVLDFIPKPFNQERLSQALNRLYNPLNLPNRARYLAVQKRGKIQLLESKDLTYIKGAGVYSELYFTNRNKEIHNKNLEKLAQLLPNHFDRIHKSFIVNNTLVQSLDVQGGGKYNVILKDGTELPISRSKYKQLKERWSI